MVFKLGKKTSNFKLGVLRRKRFEKYIIYIPKIPRKHPLNQPMADEHIMASSSATNGLMIYYDCYNKRYN